MGMASAVILACISGLLLLASGILRLGFLANFLSHPVISGFISAASIIIATSQVPTLLGFSGGGDNMITLGENIIDRLGSTHTPTLIMSVITICLLIGSRLYGSRVWRLLGLSKLLTQTVNRSVPAILVVIGTLLVQSNFEWMKGIKTVGDIPAGLPGFSLPLFNGMWHDLWIPALLITIVGYVESISVAQSLAIKRKERVNPDQELIALGFANIASAVSSGLPVTGGVSRSVVNSDAGALTPAAGLFTAIGMVGASLLLTGWLSSLPKFILSATIVVAVLSIVDFGIFKKTLRISFKDFLALVITFGLTLLINVEWGITAGVVISIGLHLYSSSKPHMAIVGQIAGTEHFRNIDRHKVEVCPDVITLRIDESLYFANARFLEQRVLDLIADNPKCKHLVLMFSAVNEIDSSAAEILETINRELKEQEIGFHLSEVKGPVMDYLKRTDLINTLNGKIFMTQFKAYEELSCFNTTS
jgi:SulP family sulfate permease